MIDFKPRECGTAEAYRSSRVRLTTTMPVSVVLVDDPRPVREGVKTILEWGSEFRVVGESESRADAVELCRKSLPDLVLKDIGLLGINDIEATRAHAALAGPPGDHSFMYDDENSVISAIRSFAWAFVLKRAFSSELLRALCMVARGGSCLSSQASDRLLMHIQRGHLKTHQRSPLEALLPRVLTGLAAGRQRQDQNCGLLDLGL